jgi:septal ring factor EnvC (AmiA/AmiB activator)
VGAARDNLERPAVAPAAAALAGAVPAMSWWLPSTLLTAIYQLREDIHAMSDSIQAELQQLTQNVAQLTSANASAEALLKGLHDQLDAALANAQQQGVDPAALQELHDLNAQIAARTTELANAVAANTPTAGNGGGAAPASGDTGETGGTAPAPSP